MKRAIKVLENRIHALNAEMKKVEKAMEEPEMLADLEFAKCDAANIELEQIELENAIKILNKYVP